VLFEQGRISAMGSFQELEAAHAGFQLLATQQK
jgi:hypothetical protein